MNSIFSQIADVFSTPLGMGILAFAILAVAAIVLWAFWGRNDVKTDAKVTAPKLAPPMLAPTVLTGGMGGVAPGDFTLRNIILGVVGLAAIIAAFTLLPNGSERSEFDVPSDHMAQDNHGTYSATGGTNGPLATRVAYSSPVTTSTSAVAAAIEDPSCEEGFTDEDSMFGYRVCTGDQAVQFDRIALARNGASLLNASWNEQSGFTMSADNQPAPFGFDDHVSLIGAADLAIDGYDAFVAVGLSEGTLSKDSDPTRLSAERAYALGRFVLTSLRGDVEQSCVSGASVVATSLGTSTTYNPAKFGTMKPVLLGVRFDRRYSSADRDLTEAVNAFVQSRGTQITGYDLVTFGQRDILFNEAVCPRLN